MNLIKSILKKRNLVGLSLVILYLLLAIPTLWNVGITWDEPAYFNAAKAHGFYFYKVANGTNPLSKDILQLWEYNNQHPPLTKILSSLTWGLALIISKGSLTLFSSLAAHRIAVVLMTALSLYILYIFTSGIYDLRTGVFATLALIFIPRFFAHSRYIALDVPVAVMWLLTVWCFWRGLHNRKYALLSGVIFGFALSTKLNAFFIPITLSLWFLISFRHEIKAKILSIKSDLEGLSRFDPLTITLISIFVIAPLVLFLTWPWLWSVLRRFGLYLKFHATHGHISVYYLGKTYKTAPWHYPFVLTAVTLPIPILIFSLFGAFKGLKRIILSNDGKTFLFLLNAFIPLLLISLPTPTYDGIRLFMPAFPFIAALAGIGASMLYERAVAQFNSKERRWVRVTLTGLIILFLVAPGLHTYVRTDPYEGVYFNSLVGGTGGALKKGFEIEYWQQAYLEAVRWLDQQVKGEENLKVYVSVGSAMINFYKHGDIGKIAKNEEKGFDIPDWIKEQKGILSEKVRLAETRSSADYIMFITRQGAFTNKDWKLFRKKDPIYDFKVDGAPVVQVYEIE